MKKKLTIKEFVKNNWILIVSLVALLLLSLVVYIIVFWGDSLNDAGAWGSLVAGIFTYIGSSFLGIVVFYNTQSQQRQKEIEDQIIIDANCYSYYDATNNYYYLFSEDRIDKEKFVYQIVKVGDLTSGTLLDKDSSTYRFFKISITNWNTHIPLYVEPIALHVFNKSEKRTRFESFIVFSDRSIDCPLDYKQTITYYLGVNKELLYSDKSNEQEDLYCFVVVKLTDINNKELFSVLTLFTGKDFQTANPIFMSKKEYDKNEKEYGYPAEPILSKLNINKTFSETSTETVSEIRVNV